MVINCLVRVISKRNSLCCFNQFSRSVFRRSLFFSEVVLNSKNNFHKNICFLLRGFNVLPLYLVVVIVIIITFNLVSASLAFLGIGPFLGI